MKDLFVRQAELLEKYGILITYFSFKNGYKNDMYRFSFKDLKNGYEHSPSLEEIMDMKVAYRSFDSFKIGLGDIISEVENYLGLDIKNRLL